MHYTVYVLIPRDTKNFEEEVLGLMDPYCEDNDAEETDMRCLCVEGRFTKEFHEQLLRDFGEPRILWKGLMEDKVSDGGEILWNSILGDFVTFANAQYDKILENSTPDPDCDECGGTGWIRTSFDLDSRWDSWEWDHGSIFKENENPPKLEPESQKHKENRPHVYDLKNIDSGGIKLPFAILSPDGWEQCEEWYKYYIVYIPEEIWEGKVLGILKEYKEECLLVPLDCHI